MFGELFLSEILQNKVVRNGKFKHKTAYITVCTKGEVKGLGLVFCTDERS